MALPTWLLALRQTEILDVVRRRPGSEGDFLLGIPRHSIFRDVIEGGQADFDQPYLHLTGHDRALLYSYFNQLGHLEELFEAFTQLFGEGAPADPLIVVDLGCGPFTAGLALAAALGNNKPFTYIGLDRSATMRELGERFAVAAELAGALSGVDRQWVADLKSIQWTNAPGWRPILVIASYLLASPVLEVEVLVEELEALCGRFGRGPMTVLYTNSPSDEANRHFKVFQAALERAGFTALAGGCGSITIDRWGGARERRLRYALFHRNSKRTLEV